MTVPLREGPTSLLRLAAQSNTAHRQPYFSTDSKTCGGELNSRPQAKQAERSGKLQRSALLDCSRRHSRAIMCTAHPTASPEWPAMGRVHARPRHHDGERRGQGGGNDAVDASTSERGAASPTFGPKMSRARGGNFVATCNCQPKSAL